MPMFTVASKTGTSGPMRLFFWLASPIKIVMKGPLSAIFRPEHDSAVSVSPLRSTTFMMQGPATDLEMDT